MDEMMDFKCVSDKMEEIPESIVKKMGGMGFPEIHTKAEYMATLSKELREYKKIFYVEFLFVIQ